MGATWRQMGMVFRPENRFSWMQTHAQLPVTVARRNGECRVFFASRDEQNRSSVGYVDLELPGMRVVQISEKPAMACGPLGCFDDHGVYPSSVVEDGDRIWLYYIGWNPGPRPPLFYSSIGLAVSENGGETFERWQPSPILARGPHDPCLVTSPCVRKEGSAWRMWYVSGLRWEEFGDTLHSYYHVKYAESDDGIDWRREGRVCLELQDGERNIARPCVVKEGRGYVMWYSSNRGEGYRIGFAESTDGLSWTRRDDSLRFESGKPQAASDVMAYPWVFDSDGDRYMFYNGPGFGRDGFCVAIAKNEDRLSGDYKRCA